MVFSKTVGSDGLDKVVELNEACKQLLARSFQVNLLALDAMVQSKRARDGLRGFGEVSAQMQMWSRDLHVKLEQLGALSVTVVNATSLGRKESHTLALLEQTVRQSAHEDIRAAHARLASAQAPSLRAIEQAWLHIDLLLADLNQLGMMACVLSRSAMIEACSAEPELHRQLEHVTQEFYSNSQAVVDILSVLMKHLR